MDKDIFEQMRQIAIKHDVAFVTGQQRTDDMIVLVNPDPGPRDNQLITILKRREQSTDVPYVIQTDFRDMFE